MVEINSNAILVEPIKNQKSDKLQRAYLVLLNRFPPPKKHVLNNMCSDSMRKLIQETCKVKLVAPYCHVDDNFPKFLWNKLLPQAELTINLLQQANVNPKLSYAYLFGLISTVFCWHRWVVPYKYTSRPAVTHPRRTVHTRGGTLDAHRTTISYTRTSIA